MSSHIYFTYLIVIKIKDKKFTTQDLSELCKLIATEISLGEELQLLVGLTHEIVVDNFIVFGFQDLKVRKSSELVDVRESVLIKINLSQVFIIL